MANSNKNSFSLVEVLVFVTIISVFFVMVVSSTIVAIRNMKYNEHKIIATHYAQELAEWLRAQKTIDWGGDICDISKGCVPSSFTAYATARGTPPTTTTYCFAEPISGWGSLSTTCSSTQLIDSIYSRLVTFNSPISSVIVLGSTNYVQEVRATITVSWNDLGNSYNVSENIVFDIF